MLVMCVGLYLGSKAWGLFCECFGGVCFLQTLYNLNFIDDRQLDFVIIFANQAKVLKHGVRN